MLQEDVEARIKEGEVIVQGHERRDVLRNLNICSHTHTFYRHWKSQHNPQCQNIWGLSQEKKRAEAKATAKAKAKGKAKAAAKTEVKQESAFAQLLKQEEADEEEGEQEEWEEEGEEDCEDQDVEDEWSKGFIFSSRFWLGLGVSFDLRNQNELNHVFS